MRCGWMASHGHMGLCGLRVSDGHGKPERAMVHGHKEVRHDCMRLN